MPHLKWGKNQAAAPGVRHGGLEQRTALLVEGRGKRPRAKPVMDAGREGIVREVAPPCGRERAAAALNQFWTLAARVVLEAAAPCGGEWPRGLRGDASGPS